MSEVISDKKVFSLLEVSRSIQRTLAERYTSSFWVKAEMNKLNHYPHSGHCYPDLVEKSEGKVVAQMRCNLWKNDYLRINEKFSQVLKEPLKDGIKILFAASISFDPFHGLSLRILDIDPSFSLGELEREKQETLEKLRQEGIFDSNKKLPLALLPQRIAVISVDTSKGYSDYLNILEQNSFGYKFFNLLFPSLLQGDKSIDSIITQLRRIKKAVHHFDAVAIIRGGGGDVGLSSYNNYNLAKEICLFPIPVITGIGHSTNETVTEMVSHKNAITPTELADFLIQKFHNFSVPVRDAEKIIVGHSRMMLKDETVKFSNVIRYFQSVTKNELLKSSNSVQEVSNTLVQYSKFLTRQEFTSINLLTQNLKRNVLLAVKNEKQQLAESVNELGEQVNDFIPAQRKTVDGIEKSISILDPVNILKRGFSITLNKDGKAVKHFSEIKAGESITTQLADGRIISHVERSEKTE